jgi:hypothetical protein
VFDGVDNGDGPDIPTEETPLVCRLSASVSETVLGQDINSKSIGFFLKNSSDGPIQTNNPIALIDGYKEIPLAEGTDTIGYGYAYFPHVSSSSIRNDIYTGAILAAQDQAVSTSQSLSSMPSLIADQLLMISNNSGKINFKNEIARIRFSNIFSLMRFEISADQELLSIPTFITQRIKSFEMYISNGIDTLTPVINIPGQYTIDLSKSPEDPGYSGPNFTSRSAKITANISESPVINTATPIIVWIAIPSLSNLRENYKVVVRMETEDSNNVSYRTFSTVSGFSSIGRNVLVRVPIVLGKKNLYSDDAVKESFVGKPANTYVVSEAGLYEIPARKINGDLPISTGDYTADWLWASKAGGGQFSDEEAGELISNISYDPENKTIRFRVGTEFSFTEGNVVLALKNAVSKEIVWTWHIWITDPPKDVEYDKSDGNIKFLDRNIGALTIDTLSSPVDTYGFVYQWGRKDPFVGGDGVVSDEGTSFLSVARDHTKLNPNDDTWGDDVKKWSRAERSEAGTIEESIKYPMMFIYNGTSSTEGVADWLSGSRAENEGWSDDAEVKTDDDPCPYGYKVPGMNEQELDTLDVLYRPWQTYFHHIQIGGGFPPGVWFYNVDNSNRYWKYYNDDTNDFTWWPVAGMRHGQHGRIENKDFIGAQLKYSGTDNSMGRGYYWTSTPLKISGVVVPGASYRIQMRNNILYSSDEYGPNADAYPVRCVKMTNIP